MTFKVLKEDWQFVIPVFVIAIVYFYTNSINKFDLAYYSGGLIQEPYRIITAHFIHADFSHLLANIGGIIVTRFFLKELRLKSKTFFIVIISCLIPLQILLQWLLDIYIFQNQSSFLIGFSGILYGIDAFILLSAVYGKRRFLTFNIELSSNYKVKESLLVITLIGFIWSLIPRISFSGHLTGFIAGSILFLF